MKTKPLFLDDSTLKSMTANILEIHPEAPGKWRVLLSETVFYPKGGGQPTDQGILSTADWLGKVYQVLMLDGEIVHYVEAAQVPPPGTVVKGEIDWPRRFLNMRLHSAGHIIDFAIYQLGLSLSPQKADHGKRAMIWYEGTPDRDIREELEARANLLVSEQLPVSTRFSSYEELKANAIYLQPNLPTNKPLRMMTIGEYCVADGGTQVANTGEVGRIAILPIETKDNITIIRYTIDHAAH